MPSNWAIAHIRVAARKESYKKQGVADRTGDTLVSPLPLLGCGRSWNESNLFSPWSVDTINKLAHRQPMNEKQRKIKFFFFFGQNFLLHFGCRILRSVVDLAEWWGVFYMAGNKLDFSKNEHTRNSFVFGVKYGPRQPSVSSSDNASPHLRRAAEFDLIFTCPTVRAIFLFPSIVCGACSPRRSI